MDLVVSNLSDRGRRLLRSLSTHNDPPSEQEEQEIYDEIQAIRREWDAFEDDSLQSSATISEFKSRILSHRQLFFPIRRLPNEILIIIFSMTMEPSLDSIKDDQTSGRGAAVAAEDILCQAKNHTGSHALMQVSSRWRALSLEMPQLWNNIFLSPASLSPYPHIVGYSRGFRSLECAPTLLNEPKALDVFHHHVNHSQSLPLDICVHYKVQTQTSRSLLKAIIGVAPRWAVFRFIVRQADFSPEWFRELKGTHFAYLQELDFMFNGYGFDLLPLESAFTDAPHLTTVRWLRDSPGEHTPVIDFSLPWSQLTCVEFDLRDADLPVLLAKCPKLQSLTYRLYTDDFPPWENRGPFVHENLRHLSLRIEMSAPMQTIFCNLRLPNLTTLQIQRTPLGDETLPTTIEMFIDNCRPRHLKELVIDNFPFGIRFMCMLNVLSETCPELKKLHMGFQLAYTKMDPNARSSLAQYMLQKLTVVVPSQGTSRLAFFPRLEEFCLRLRGKLEKRDNIIPVFTGDFLYRMVQSRRDTFLTEATGVQSMKRFQVDFLVHGREWSSGDFVCLERLKELENEEFKVVLPIFKDYLKEQQGES